MVLLLLWGGWELRARGPLVDLRTTARRQVLLTNIASAVFGFAMFAMSLVLPQLLQLSKATGYGLGQSMLAVGLVMAPNGLVMMAMAPLSARISSTRGPKITLMSGAAVVAVGYGLSVVLMTAIWQLVLAIASFLPRRPRNAGTSPSGGDETATRDVPGTVTTTAPGPS